MSVNHRGNEIQHGVEVNGVWVGHTVQTCPECQNGMAWDNQIHKHIPRDDYDFKHWTGTSPGLMGSVQMCLDNSPRFRSLYINNIVRLLPMAVHECRMIRVLIKHLTDAGPSPVLNQDIVEYTAILNDWKQIMEKVKAMFPELTVVQECNI